MWLEGDIIKEVQQPGVLPTSFCEVGSRGPPVTQTYLSSQAITAPFVPREASAAGRLRSNAVSRSDRGAILDGLLANRKLLRAKSRSRTSSVLSSNAVSGQ